MIEKQLPVPLLAYTGETPKSYLEVFSHDERPKLLHKVECLTAFDTSVPHICEAAQAGFQKWSAIPIAERMQVLDKAASLLREQKDALIQLFKELGLPTWFSVLNAVEVADQLSEYVRSMSRPTGDVLHTELTNFAFTELTPIGLVLSISPWNAPGILTGRTISAPLAAGCSVVLKTSDLAPFPAYLIVKAFHDAGVPKETLQLVNIEPEHNAQAVKLFIENPIIKKISFTGSSLVGRKIAQIAAANLKPLILELGGKNVAIIERDADLNKAVASNLWGSWGHKGQICMSTDQIYVHADIFDEFIERLQPVADKLLEDSDYLLPQRTKEMSTKVRNMVLEALEQGATILCGDSPTVTDTNHPISPLVLGNVTEGMRINEEETFGPVVCVYKYEDAFEVVRYLNTRPYGLKSSIWTRNVLAAHKLAKQLDCGGVHINSPTVYDERTTPHGGVKESGFGRFNSRWGIEEFSYTKVITMSE